MIRVVNAGKIYINAPFHAHSPNEDVYERVFFFEIEQ